MKKKEFAVGEVFQFGLIKLKVVKRKRYCCNGCYFLHKDDLQCGEDTEELIGHCTSSERSDKASVIFVKVED